MPHGLYPLFDIVIFQIISNTPRANWKRSKTKNARAARKIASAGYFNHTNHLLNVSFLIRHLTTKKESKPHFYATKRVWLTTRKPFFTKMFTNQRFLLASRSL